MLNLAYVLSGIQDGAVQHTPPAWEQVCFTEAVTDSRDVGPHALFVAIAGERTNGHNFLPDVAHRGARGALVQYEELVARHDMLAHIQRPWIVLDGLQSGKERYIDEVDAYQVRSLSEQPDSQVFILIAVDSPLKALQRLAAYHRRQLTPTMIGITGSVGKTSTKEVAAAVLQRRFCTLKSKRSYNSEVTVPTTLLHLRPHHAVAVVELGMWAPGEIRFLANLARPHIGVVCNVGPSHLERMTSIDAIASAKAELVEALPPEGIAILNADDERVAAMAQRCEARVFRYGTSTSADLWADDIRSHGLNGVTFRAHYQDQVEEVVTPLPGHHSVYTALAAASIALVLGLSWDDIRAGLQDKSAHIRLQVVSGGSSTTPYTVIDDTYNASPVSSLAALNLLAECGTRNQRIAVLGDMLELGALEEEAHRMVGRRAACVVQHLVCVGTRARWIAEEAHTHGLSAARIHVVEQSDQAIPLVQAMVHPGDYVLVKGSRSVAMEQIVTTLRSPNQEATVFLREEL